MKGLVSVVLPAYNAQDSIGEAIESILRQTHRRLELLVFDDGSTDRTAAVLAGIRDDRMRVLTHDANRGLIWTLNEGLDGARGEFVARMDADDVAHPRRLERQVAFLQAHPDTAVCGTWFKARLAGRRSAVRPPATHEEIVAELFFRSAFAHPTVMMRRDFLLASGLRYDEQARHAEDFDLWVRAARLTRLANIPAYLLEYRLHGQQVSTLQGEAQMGSAARIRLAQLSTLFPEASREQQALHLRLCDPVSFARRDELLAARSWLDELEERNAVLRRFQRQAFRSALARTWFACCARASVPASEVLGLYLSRRRWGRGIERLRGEAVIAYRALRHAVAA